MLNDRRVGSRSISKSGQGLAGVLYPQHARPALTARNVVDGGAGKAGARAAVKPPTAHGQGREIGLVTRHPCPPSHATTSLEFQ